MKKKSLVSIIKGLYLGKYSRLEKIKKKQNKQKKPKTCFPEKKKIFLDEHM